MSDRETRIAQLDNENLLNAYTAAAIRYGEQLNPRASNEQFRKALDELHGIRRELYLRLNANQPPF